MSLDVPDITALDGLVMGTRCGALDPGAVLYLLQQRGMTARGAGHAQKAGLTVEEMLDFARRHAPLLEKIEHRARVTPAAGEAIDLFVWQIARQAGALASSLGGLDSFVL
jgi:acetate kinase